MTQTELIFPCELLPSPILIFLVSKSYKSHSFIPSYFCIYKLMSGWSKNLLAAPIIIIVGFYLILRVCPRVVITWLFMCSISFNVISLIMSDLMLISLSITALFFDFYKVADICIQPRKIYLRLLKLD